MRAGGFLGLSALVVVFARADQMRESVAREFPGADSAELDRRTGAGLSYAFLMIALEMALWFITAHLNLRGKWWARVLAGIFFAGNVLLIGEYFIGDFVVLDVVFHAVYLIIGAAALSYLWQRDSTVYFEGHKR